MYDIVNLTYYIWPIHRPNAGLAINNHRLQQWVSTKPYPDQLFVSIFHSYEVSASNEEKYVYLQKINILNIELMH